MKKEIFLTELQRSQIIDIFAKLDASEKDLLSLLALTCETGVNRRDLHSVLDKVQPVLDEKLNVLLHEGLLLESADAIFCPIEVSMTIIPQYAPPTEMLNGVMKALVNALQPWELIDSSMFLPYFNMAEGLVDHLVEHETEDIDWIRFGQLVVRYVELWHEFGTYEPGIFSKNDTLVMRSIHLTKSHVKDDGALYSKLITLEALLWTEGFEFDKARHLLSEAENLQEEPTALFLFVNAMYHMCYGNTVKGLTFLFQAYLIGESYLHSLIASIIGYNTILLERTESTLSWLQKYHWSNLPKHSLITFFSHLTFAFLDGKEEEFALAKDCVMSSEAPILAVLYGAQAKYMHEQPRKAASFFKEALRVTARYGSMDSGYYLLRAHEIKRMISDKNLVTAGIMLKKLDVVDLSCADNETSLELRLHCCEAYSKYYFAIEEYAMSKIYSEAALELLEAYKPEKKDIDVASKIFTEGFANFTMWDDMFCNVTLMILKAGIEEIRQNATEPGCLLRKNNPYKTILKKLHELSKEYPAYRSDADVVAAYIVSFKKPEKAVEWWKKIIRQTPRKEKCRIAVEAAGYASGQGLIWEAVDLLEEANAFESLFAINNERRAIFLMHLAEAIEETGLRGNAIAIWEDVYELAKGTEILPAAYFAAAYEAFEHCDYVQALELIKQCLANYRQEAAYSDETLVSVLCYKSVILAQLKRYKEARKVIKKAIRIYPDPKCTFNLLYNLAYYNMALKDYQEARKTLVKAKELIANDAQQKKVEELYEILAIPVEKRQLYFRWHKTDSDDVIYY